jgi:hypothetical protein
VAGATAFSVEVARLGTDELRDVEHAFADGPGDACRGSRTRLRTGRSVGTAWRNPQPLLPRSRLIGRSNIGTGRDSRQARIKVDLLPRINSARNNESLDATLMAPVRVDCPFQPSRPPRGIMGIALRNGQARRCGISLRSTASWPAGGCPQTPVPGWGGFVGQDPRRGIESVIGSRPPGR